MLTGRVIELVEAANGEGREFDRVEAALIATCQSVADLRSMIVDVCDNRHVAPLARSNLARTINLLNDLERNGHVPSSTGLAAVDSGKRIRVVGDVSFDDSNYKQPGQVLEGANFGLRTVEDVLYVRGVGVLDPNSGVIFEESVRAKSRYKFGATASIPSEVHKGLREAVVLQEQAPNNYYHALLDICYPIFAIRAVDSSIPIVVPFTLRRVVEAFLGVFPDYREQLVLEPECCSIDQCHVVITGTRRSGLRQMIEVILSTAQREISSTGLARPESIYVSRRDAKARPMLNEAELEEELKDLGVRIVVLSELSVDEQWRTFMGTKRVIGPHGAGLTNLIFLPSGSDVVEIHPPGNRARLAFERLTDQFDHHYWAIEGLGQGADGWKAPIEEVVDTVSTLEL